MEVWIRGDFPSHRIFELSAPSRLVIDLFRVQTNKVPSLMAIENCGIVRIRTAFFGSDVVRVVFDALDQIPGYELSRVAEGLKLVFWLPPVLSAGKKIEAFAKTEENVQEKREQTVETRIANKAKASAEVQAGETVKDTLLLKQQPTEAEGGRKIEGKEEPAEIIRRQLEETQTKLDDALKILNEMNEERLRRKEKFFRVLVEGHSFRPHEGVLKDVYRRGISFGAELNIGVADDIELFLSESYFGKTVADSEPDKTRKVVLIPFEIGFKFRFNKGLLNPYLGVGGGYFQYREESAAGTVREKKIGFVGKTGVFLKLWDSFVFDVYVRYSYCPIEISSGKFDVGGLRYGLGFGAEF